MAIDAVTAFLHRKAIRRVKRKLSKGEAIEAATPGDRKGRQGILLLTTKRMIWVPKRGKLEIRPRTRVHDVRTGEQSGIVAANQPSWQVQHAPAAAARTFANASRADAAARKPNRLERIERLKRDGLITQAEYEWMRKE